MQSPLEYYYVFTAYCGQVNYRTCSDDTSRSKIWCSSWGELGVITIACPKTRRREARVQHVTVESLPLLRLLKFATSLVSSEEAFVFPTYKCMRSEVSMILNKLLGPKHGYTLAGLRGAGATVFYLRFRNVPDLMRRGRWASAKTLEHYIQIAGALITQRLWSEAIDQRVSSWAAGWAPLLEHA